MIGNNEQIVIEELADAEANDILRGSCYSQIGFSKSLKFMTLSTIAQKEYFDLLEELMINDK